MVAPRLPPRGRRGDNRRSSRCYWAFVEISRYWRRGRAADATPAAGATLPEVNLEGTWLCSQPYALCSMSPCERTLSNAQVATCPCTVETGYSIGYKTCGERAPAGQTLISTFSTANVSSSVRAMTCSERNVWANCLDMPCLIDPDDPAQATCLCPLEESADYLTAGGDCELSTCSSVIWSAASISGNLVPLFESAMKQVDEHVNLPAICPNATPPAS